LEVFNKLSKNPSDPSLKTHKIFMPNNTYRYSSSVTGDIRIIWNYDIDGIIQFIELIDIGGHSGKSGVY
jgi:mRNA-degrading endonuclease YafQ of YafQ-DinJ toxin-antitoxin module